MHGQLILVAIACLTSAARPEEVDVRLDGGSGPNEGTVMVRRGSDWGVVCDDEWDIRDGSVICKQLGYKRIMKVTTYNFFKSPPKSKVLLDDVKCSGFEKSLGDCRHRGWGVSNCHGGEAAGVICSKDASSNSTSVGGQVTLRTPVNASAVNNGRREGGSGALLEVTGSLTLAWQTPPSEKKTTTRGSFPNASPPPAGAAPMRPLPGVPKVGDEFKVHDMMSELAMESSRVQYGLRITGAMLLGGRFAHEGYVQLTLADGRRGSICADNWGIFEAMVACRQLGHSYARQATNADYFGGVGDTKLLYELNCDGHESSLSDCSFREVSPSGVKCSKPQSIAGMVCTKAELPDLVPNIPAIIASLFIQEVPLRQLECALEERCLSSSAYSSSSSHYNDGQLSAFGLSSYFSGWTVNTRRLLRFASNIYNNGTADFRPVQHRSAWEWHACHMHWHSMSTFTHYDVVDKNGNRVAEGHKASFCLEDVECKPGVKAKYSCRGFGEQGISVGCADVYKQDIDCQWIDITDIKPGTYIFKLTVNPEYKVAELSYDNNAVTCEMTYSGYSAKLRDCVLGRG